MIKEYNDKEFLDKIRLSIEWFNIKSACAVNKFNCIYFYTKIDRINIWFRGNEIL